MQTTSSQYFKGLSILCYALIGGLVMFSLIILFLNISGISANVPGLGNTFNIIVAVLAIIGLFAGNAVFKNRVQALKEMPGLADKLNGYRAAVVLRYALLDGPAIFSIIACFLTGELKLLIATGALVSMMLYLFPTKQAVIKQLELSSSEESIINDPNGIIQ